jgi:hypothetical protein
VNILVKLTLDHSIMVEMKGRTIFLSEYILFLVIKKIINSKFTVGILALILGLVQLKRFNLMCTLNFDEKTDSIKVLLERHLIYLNSLPDTDI